MKTHQGIIAPTEEESRAMRVAYRNVLREIEEYCEMSLDDDAFYVLNELITYCTARLDEL